MRARPGGQDVTVRPGWPAWRRWLAVTGLVLVLACLLPPLDMLARHYVFAETIQFCVLAMAGPALIVLGAPWRFLRLARADGTGPADQLAATRRDQQSILRALVFLLVFVGVALVWRLPSVIDALSRQPALVAAEAVTLLAAGIGLWLELVDSPPLAPRLPRPQRALVATLAMWSTWAVAYVLGFTGHAVFRPYDSAGSVLGAVTDQEIAVGLVWAVAGFCFLPVVIVTMLGWLRDGDDEEFQRVYTHKNQPAMVRGWESRSRRRPTSSR